MLDVFVCVCVVFNSPSAPLLLLPIPFLAVPVLQAMCLLTGAVMLWQLAGGWMAPLPSVFTCVSHIGWSLSVRSWFICGIIGGHQIWAWLSLHKCLSQKEITFMLKSYIFFSFFVFLPKNTNLLFFCSLMMWSTFRWCNTTIIVNPVWFAWLSLTALL